MAMSVSLATRLFVQNTNRDDGVMPRSAFHLSGSLRWELKPITLPTKLSGKTDSIL